MFILGKIIGQLVVSPAIFIALFIFIGIFSNRYNVKKIKRMSLILGIVLYVITIRPTVDLTAKLVENRFKPATAEEIKKGEAYVVLGGGIIEKTPVGNIPSEPASVRLMNTAILYNKQPKKIYITGGKVTNQQVSESSVYKRVLVGLNISESDIRTEEESRTTMENARYTSELLRKSHIENIILVTSASHMARSKMTFEKQGFNVIPAPCGYIQNRKNYNILDFIPRSENFSYFMRLTWEVAGIVYYGIRGYL
ncbi:YdcF family protein [uncultured Ilyobacter sp.]|uniref:YdcF family protein n=1 Tax=uncultured Ilyobacter sp. TaxID=544433 RepID=UPI0029F5A915|nr:YdcF family protein [uncultured Ilyobacter sp.]